jgi:hypothetical protein
MPIRVAEVRAAAAAYRTRTQKSDRVILAEAVESERTRFDIFLSHSFDDRELVVGTKRLIEDRGLTVYVDWIDDALLDRSAVDRERADHLRTRMQQCDTLFYAHTPNAALSRWCPWELGYFDALKAPDKQVYVLPVEDDERYEGQEYLSLYEPVDLASYKHNPTIKREQARFERDRLFDAFGVRRIPPFGRPIF